MTKSGLVLFPSFNRCLRLGLALSVLLAFLMVSGVPAHAETTLIRNLPPVSSVSFDFGFGPGERIAQAFLTGPDNRVLSSVILRLTANSGFTSVAVCDDNPGLGPSTTCTQLPSRDPVSGFYYRFSEARPRLENEKTLTGGGVKYWVVVTNTDASATVSMTSASNLDETGDGAFPGLPEPLESTFGYWTGSWGIYDQKSVVDEYDPDWVNTYPVFMFQVSYANATSVELFDFAAAWSGDGALVTWMTGSEQDNAGFHVWRSDSENGDYTRLTDSLIPAEGGAAQGASYSFRDPTAVPGVTYFYKLEDVDTAGVSTFHGPVQAIGEAVVEPAISLVAPDAGARVRNGRRPRFAWSGETSTRFQIRFSRTADPAAPWIGLPGTKSRSTRSGSWTSRSFYVPTAAEWQRVRQMGWRGGTVYWWVVGTDDAGNVVTTGARELRVR